MKLPLAPGFHESSEQGIVVYKTSVRDKDLHLLYYRSQVDSLGRNCSVHVVDVSDRAQMELLPEQVIAEHGAVHILVNNAGVSVNLNFLEQDLDDLEWITGINYWGVIYGCKFFLPYLMEAEEGHIVNISSINGFFPFPNNGPYSCAKHAVKALNQTLGQELYGSPIKITSVHPGGIKTNIANHSRFLDPHQSHVAAIGFQRGPDFLDRIGHAILHTPFRPRC